MNQFMQGLLFFGGVIVVAGSAQVLGDAMRFKAQQEEAVQSGEVSAVSTAQAGRQLARLDDTQSQQVLAGITAYRNKWGKTWTAYDEAMKKVQQYLLSPSYLQKPEQLDYQLQLLDSAGKVLAHYQQQFDALDAREAETYRTQGFTEDTVSAMMAVRSEQHEELRGLRNKVLLNQRDYLQAAQQAVTFLQTNAQGYVMNGGKVHLTDTAKAEQYTDILRQLSTYSRMRGESIYLLENMRRKQTRTLQELLVSK